MQIIILSFLVGLLIGINMCWFPMYKWRESLDSHRESIESWGKTLDLLKKQQDYIEVLEKKISVLEPKKDLYFIK